MKHLLLSLAIIFCLFSSLQAQTKKEEKGTKLVELEDVVVTAQYAPTDSKNSLHEVRVIKGVEIEKQGFNNLSEVLQNQLNLRVSTDPILGNGLAIQGIGGENIQILIDGVPVIGRVGGNIDLSQINLQNVDRIEIIEGAMSAQYGSNASGGVINIIRKKSQLNKIQLESRNHYENIGILNNALSVGYRGNKFYASVTGSRYNSQFAEVDSLRIYETRELPSGDTYRTRTYPWNPKLQYGIDGLLRYQFSDSTNLVYQYRMFDEDLSLYGERRRPRFRPYAFDEVFSTIRQDHSLTLESYLSPRIYLKSTTAYNVYDRTSFTDRLDFESDTSFVLEGSQDTARFTALLHRSILSNIGEGKWNAQLGIEALYETGSGGRIVDSTSLPLNEAQLGNYAAWLGIKFAATESWTLSTNVRYGYNTRYDYPVIPSFHANWNNGRSWDFKISYALGFRAPSLKELHFNFIDVNHYIIGNPELQAEKSQNASAILNYRKKFTNKQEIGLTGKVFYNYIKDRISLAEFSALQFNYQNIAKYETHGFNIRAQYKLGEHIRFNTGFALTRLFNLWSEGFESEKFINLPEVQQDLQVRIPGIETNLLITHRFTGRQIRFFQNQEGQLEEGYVGKFHLVNATLSRNFWEERIFMAFGVKNLFDTQTLRVVGQGGGGAHSTVGNSQLFNWGRTYFIRMNLNIYKRGY
ncbi:MAG: TonB-dependent receptor [Bacteroidota bacterium]